MRNDTTVTTAAPSDPGATRTSDPTPRPSGVRRSRVPRLRSVAAVAAAFALGLTVAWLGERGSGPSDRTQPAAERPVGAAPGRGDADGAAAPPTVGPGEGGPEPRSDPRSEPWSETASAAKTATAPRDAVAGFLAAEAVDDFDASFSYLAAADQAAYAGPADWRAAHGRMPDILGFEVTAVDDDTVTTSVTLDSALDPVLGLVPARASIAWEVVEEAAGWRVTYGEAVVTPRYPPDAGAARAAAAWAAARQACEPDAEIRVGSLSLPERLCGADGEVVVGEPEPLGPAGGSSDLVAAYGPEAVEWARIVPLRSPERLRLLLAPVDDTWLVVGAEAARSTP